MTGMPSMADMLKGGGDRQASSDAEPEPKRVCKPKIGGFLKKAIVGGNAC